MKNKQKIEYDSNKKIETIFKIVFWGFIAAFLYHFVMQKIFLSKDYPLNTFLFLPSDRFNDLYNLLIVCKNLNPYFEPFFLGNSNYLPFANILIWVLSMFSKQIALAVFILVVSALIYFFTYNSLPKAFSNLKKHKYAFVISFLNYGYWFCVDRANFELIVAVLIMAFLFFYTKGKTHLSTVFLAMAAATKIYPIIFIILFLSEKKYKEVSLAILYTVAFILFPLFLQHGSFIDNLNFIFNGFELDTNSSSFAGAFEDKGNYLLQGTSFFSALKILNIKLSLGLNNMLTKYFIMVAIIALGVIYYTIFIEKSTWRKVTLFTSLLLILPHISFDYKFIHILFCVYLYINEKKEEENNKIDYKKVTIIFGLLLIPKSYFYFNKIMTTTTGKMDVPFSTLLNPILIIVLCFIIIYSGIKFYKIKPLKQQLIEHLTEIRRSIIYLLPLLLLVAIPYFIFSKAAHKTYSSYKESYLKSQDLLSKNQKQEAVNELKKAFAFKEYKFQLPLQIAGLYNELGKLDSSMIYYKKTLQIFPNCVEANNGLLATDVNLSNAKSIELLNLKDFISAEMYLKKAIEAFKKLPNNSSNLGFEINLYCNLCTCYINQKKWTDANNALTKIKALDIENVYVKNNEPLIVQMLNK